MASDCARVYERLECAVETGFLDLSSCKLTQIPNGLLMVMKSSSDNLVVKKCSLAKNLLKNFPPKLVKEEKLFGQLEVLDISSNKLTQLPSEIESMKTLNELHLSGNKFEYLPEIVWRLPELKILSLAGNEIADVDARKIRDDAKKLEKLDLSANPLRDEVVNELERVGRELGIDIVL